MLAPSLLRAGLALKLNQIKLAVRSYLRDRTNQATATVTSYAVAAGLFAAAGIFLIAACLVGIAALFRWVEIKYGMFWAFGVAGGLLLVLAAICAAIAASRLNPRQPHFPSLSSRLRVAINANPAKSGQIETARDNAAAVLRAPAAPVTHQGLRTEPRRGRDNRDIRTGLILVGTLLGWAMVRRRHQARRTVA
jgi:Putative Actinobacterial Holin-X, holin superfamily III